MDHTSSNGIADHISGASDSVHGRKDDPSSGSTAEFLNADSAESWVGDGDLQAIKVSAAYFRCLPPSLLPGPPVELCGSGPTTDHAGSEATLKNNTIRPVCGRKTWRRPSEARRRPGLSAPADGCLCISLAASVLSGTWSGIGELSASSEPDITVPRVGMRLTLRHVRQGCLRCWVVRGSLRRQLPLLEGLRRL